MKKILVVTEGFYPENFLINDLVKQWQNDGYKVDILTQWPSYPAGKIYPGYTNKYYATESWGTSTIHRFKLVEGYKKSLIKRILNYWTFVWVGSKIARKIGGDYDHVLVYQTGPLTVALPAVTIKKKFGIPITTWTFDLWPNAIYAYGFPKIQPIKWLATAIVRNVYKNSDNILVSSKNFIQTIQQYVPEKTITYAPNWLIPEASVKSELRLPIDKFNFTFTGNICIAQNLENVIKGFAKANIKGTVLNIIGDGTKYDSLKVLITGLKLKNVILHGRYPYNQMADILTQSDFLILPLMANDGVEKTEPFKIQSYLNAKKPILGILRGSGREIILENNVGICANPADIDDIAVAFTKAINFAKDHSQTVQDSSEKLMQTRFNRAVTIGKITELI